MDDEQTLANIRLFIEENLTWPSTLNTPDVMALYLQLRILEQLQTIDESLGAIYRAIDEIRDRQ